MSREGGKGGRVVLDMWENWEGGELGRWERWRGSKLKGRKGGRIVRRQGWRG